MDVQVRVYLVRLTSVSTSATVADSIAVDFPGDVALAVVVIYSRVNGATLVEGAYQRLVADGRVWSGDTACFRCTNAMFRSVLFCCGTVVHHVGAIVLL